MDWWPSSKCDYGDCPWANASVLTADLTDPLLISAIKALSPVALRIGGSLADEVTYGALPPKRSTSCSGRSAAFELDLSRRVGFRGGCLLFERWLELLELCTLAGCHVIFSVNALHGRVREACPPKTLCRKPNARSHVAAVAKGAADGASPVRPSCCSNYSTGAWDHTNLKALLQATAASGHRPAGLAFGNELVTDKGIEAHLPAREYARDVRRFGNLVRSVWPTKPPLLLAPDTNHVDEAWLTEFFAELWPPPPPPSPTGGGADADADADGDSPGDGPPPPIDLFSHHLYPLGAGDEAGLRAKLVDPKRLDQGIGERLRIAHRVVTNLTHGQARVCVSETGGAYNSGQRGVTDAFGSAFWWLDLLGSLGKHGHDFACRQALLGGNYALIDLHRRQPNPDFWVLLLWRRIVSPKVLRVVKLFARSGPHENASSSSNGSGGGWGSFGGRSSNSSNVEAVRGRPSLAMLRAYGACARSGDLGLNVMGGVVVFFINLSPTSTHVVNVDLNVSSVDPNGTTTPRVDFVLTARSLASREVSLNGHVLRARRDGSISEVEGVPHAGTVIHVAPLSVTFHVFPDARHAACFTQPQQAERSKEIKREQARAAKQKRAGARRGA